MGGCYLVSELFLRWNWGCFTATVVSSLVGFVLFVVSAQFNLHCGLMGFCLASIFCVNVIMCVCCVVHPPSFDKLLLFTVELTFTLEGHYLGSFSDCTSPIYHISTKDMSGNFLYAYIETDIWYQNHQWCTQDASESPVVLAVSAVGCPIRRRMSVTILPVEPYSTMAMVLKSDGRPGYRTATWIILEGW